MYEYNLIQLIVNFIGYIPDGYQWIVGICAIILFTFITFIVFELICAFFGMLSIGGGRRG